MCAGPGQRGTADFAVPFEGGATPVTKRIVFLGAQATFDKWAELDGCSGAEQDIGNNCKKVSQCQAGTEVNLCVIQGGGHQPGVASTLWPLLPQYAPLSAGHTAAPRHRCWRTGRLGRVRPNWDSPLVGSACHQ